MKKAQMSVEKIVKLVIVTIVVVLVILLFWKTDIYGKFIKLIPGNWSFGDGNGGSSNLPPLQSVNLDKQEIKKIMQYAENNKVESRKCNCADKCDIIAEGISEASQKYNIPNPLLLLSMIMQESSCNYMAVGGGSVGLMQITKRTFDSICLEKDKVVEVDGKKITSFNDIQGSSDWNIKANIYCGAKILRRYYNENSKRGIYFKGCYNKNTWYYGWNAAVRAYNGKGCPRTSDEKTKHETDNYVESVVTRLKLLEKQI